MKFVEDYPYGKVVGAAVFGLTAVVALVVKFMSVKKTQKTTAKTK